MSRKEDRREYPTYCLVCNGIRLCVAYTHKGVEYIECCVCGHTKKLEKEPS